MHWNHAFHAVVNAGLWRDALTWTVFTILTLTLGGIRLWRSHIRVQQKIADHLDTRTPGGLTDVVSKLEHLLTALQQHNRLSQDR